MLMTCRVPGNAVKVTPVRICDMASLLELLMNTLNVSVGLVLVGSLSDSKMTIAERSLRVYPVEHEVKVIELVAAV